MAQGSYKILSLCIVFISVEYSYAMDEFEPYDLFPEESYFTMQEPRQDGYQESQSLESQQLPRVPSEQPIQVPVERDASEGQGSISAAGVRELRVAGSDSHMPMALSWFSTAQQLYELIVLLNVRIEGMYQKVSEHEQKLDRLHTTVQSFSRTILQCAPKNQLPVVAQEGPVYSSREHCDSRSSRHSVMLTPSAAPVTRDCQKRGRVYEQQQGSALYTLLRNRYMQVQKERKHQSTD